VMLIFFILYTMFGSFKWAMLIMANVVIAPIGGTLALFVTGTTSASPPVLGFWRCSACRCRPAHYAGVHQPDARPRSLDRGIRG